MFSALLAAALVWAPPETFTQWSKVDALLRSRSDLKMTVALTPQMVTPLAKSALASWVATGRVEVAVRVHGDPILSIVAAHPAAPRPDDALERSSDARRAVERRLGARVSGFVPGEGALDSSLIGPLGASGLLWVLTGAYDVAGASWAAEGHTVFVPARSADLTAPGPVVIDESTQTSSNFIAAFTALGSQRPVNGWSTISDLVGSSTTSRPPASSVPSWPGWNRSTTMGPAYAAYGEAAKALERYQNSGAADLKVLESATILLRKAQEARFFRPLPPGAPNELNARLLAVYKRLKAAAPDSLYASNGDSRGSAADQPTGVHSTSSKNWINFENPVGSTARAPVGSPNADPWRLRGLRVEWNDQRVLFRIFPAHVDTSTAPPHPIYDIYIDLNHVLGAGEIRLLDGRGAFAQARDAWEFALSLSGPEAILYRAMSGEPETLSTLRVETDPQTSEIRVAVSRDELRGNPARWGYILLSLAADPARPGRTPTPVLVGPDGSQTLGLLGSLEFQRNLIDHPGTPQRVPAVRLDSPSAK